MTLQKRSLRDYLVVEGSLAFVAVIPAATVFSHRAYGPIAVAMALIAAASRTHWRELLGGFSQPIKIGAPQVALPLSLAALSAWIVATAFWSPAANAGWLGALLAAGALGTYFIVAEMLARETRGAGLLAFAFVLSSVVALLLLFFEARTGGYLRLITPPADVSVDRFKDITALGRGFAALAPSFFPTAALLLFFAPASANRPLRVTAIALLFLGALSTALSLTIGANTAALVAGAGASLLAVALPRLTIALLSAAFVFAIAFAPLMALLPSEAIATEFAGILPASWLQRVLVWRNLSVEALGCLPLGCGADYARMLAEQREMFVLPGSGETVRAVPTHPHNIFLQIWLELGLPGVALAFIAFLTGGKLALEAKNAPACGAALCGAAAATFVYWTVEASLWQGWRLASIAIAAAGIAICANVYRRAQ